MYTLQKELIKRRLIQNFNIRAGATPRVIELLKIGSFKFPPPFLPPPPRTKLRSNVPLKHNFLFENSLSVQQMLKETTVKSRSSRLECIGVYWSEHSESVKQYARIVISSLEVARYDCLPHRFSLTFQPPLFSVEN